MTEIMLASIAVSLGLYVVCLFVYSAVLGIEDLLSDSYRFYDVAGALCGHFGIPEEHYGLICAPHTTPIQKPLPARRGCGDGVCSKVRHRLRTCAPAQLCRIVSCKLIWPFKGSYIFYTLGVVDAPSIFIALTDQTDRTFVEAFAKGGYTGVCVCAEIVLLGTGSKIDRTLRNL